MTNKSLPEMIRDMVESNRVRLPIQPQVARQIMACINAEKLDAELLWSLIGRDPALLCNLFRAANSAFFAGLHKTLSIEEAVTRLGNDKAVEVLKQACQEAERRPQGELLPRYMPLLWQHAQGCALGAKWLANRCGYQAIADQVYLAGLLHDIGKQFLLAALEEISLRGELGMILTDRLIQEVIATMHVEQGLRFFEDWNLAEIYRDVVAGHHDEELDKQNIVVALVKLANKGCRKVGLGLTKQPEIVLPTSGEAQFLGIDEIALAEFEIMLEDNFSLQS